MSKAAGSDSRPSWTSKTTFDALGVESGEESEEEVLEEPAQESSSEPPKPSKTALKKAKAAARLEKRRQEKAARAAARAQAAKERTSDAASTVSTQSSPSSPSTSVRALDDVKTNIAPPASEHDADLPAVMEEKPNGDAVVPEALPEEPQDKLPAKPIPVSAPPPAPPAPVVPRSIPVQPPPEPLKPSIKAAQQTHNGHVAVPVQTTVNPQEAEHAKKLQNALTRTLWTFIMIGGFITLLLMGHAYMILLVMLCQMLVYREVTALFSLKRKGEDSVTPESRGRDPWSKTLNWYFFAVVNYFLYGESIIYYFKHVVFSDAQLTMFATNHRIISFSLYTIGFVGFVMSLQRGYLKQQFGLFCWVHMTLLFIVASSHFIVNNILEGMIWFWVPASLVICNDVFAYVWGITLGRTPLIKLSPKKTVEGFVGAFFSTVLFGVLWGTYFMRFNYMICPVHDLGVSAFDGTIHCKPNPVFVWRDWTMPAPLSVFLSTLLGRAVTTIPYVPYQFHLLLLSCFASLVAPFGGFFASGFKRAFNIKDFGHSIPGHGGITDRMDCQFLMGVFTYVYYSSFIREHHVNVGSLLQMIVSGLTVGEQLQLMADLKRYIEGQGISVNL